MCDLTRRSTKRLERDLATARRRSCECDSYHGFVCGKHGRVLQIKEILAGRAALRGEGS